MLTVSSTSLERVVITSSCAAIAVFSMDKVTLSETDWNEPPVKACEEQGKDASVADMYCASKVLSERGSSLLLFLSRWY